MNKCNICPNYDLCNQVGGETMCFYLNNFVDEDVKHTTPDGHVITIKKQDKKHEEKFIKQFISKFKKKGGKDEKDVIDNAACP